MDDIHKCEECELNPCTSSEEVEDSCEDCPTPGQCCLSPIIPILPCEEGHYELRDDGIHTLKTVGQYCYAFDTVTKRCTIYEKRPMACRIHECGFLLRKRLSREFENMK